MNNRKNVNVAVIARFEENEKDFIELVRNSEINFFNVQEENLELKLKKSINSADKVILLIDSIDGVTPKMSDIIDEIVNQKITPIVVLNNISNAEAKPEMAIEEIEHVLVMANASDEQLEFPVVYLDNENKSATLNLDEKGKNFKILYDLLIS